MFTYHSKCGVLSALIVTLLLTATAEAAAVMSFNLRSNKVSLPGTAMASTEQAGAAGVYHDNWNDVLASSTGGTTLSAGTIRDETGAIVNGTTFSVTGPSFPEQFPGYGTGTTKMFSGGFDIGPKASSSDLNISLTGITYATYDVYVYSVGGSSTTRGGDVWLNGFLTGARKSLRHASTRPNLGYTEANDTDAFDNLTAQGSYLVFRGQYGSSLTLDFEAGASQRFPIAGIQIVGTSVAAVPEPSTLVMFGVGLLCLPASRLRKKSLRV
ncbi:MAG: PEP-CTERM sorting domain-containing protein [Planctomyces sp.]|nr:PEP-CTERM sorting domain-containing protein [Planctomyces sp.]